MPDAAPPTFLLVEAIHAALPQVSPAACRIAALNVQKALVAELKLPAPPRGGPGAVALDATARYMGDRHRAIDVETFDTVLEVIEAAGAQVLDLSVPTIADVQRALRADELHDEAREYWHAPEDGTPTDDQRIGGMLTWLAEYLPQHIREEEDPGE